MQAAFTSQRCPQSAGIVNRRSLLCATSAECGSSGETSTRFYKAHVYEIIALRGLFDWKNVLARLPRDDEIQPYALLDDAQYHVGTGAPEF